MVIAGRGFDHSSHGVPGYAREPRAQVCRGVLWVRPGGRQYECSGTFSQITEKGLGVGLKKAGRQKAVGSKK